MAKAIIRGYAMSYHALLQLLYQILLILAGLVTASLSIKYRSNVGQWFGGFVSAVAAIWAAWTGTEQFYIVMKPFAEKWLGLAQVLATLFFAVVIFILVLFITERPKEIIQLGKEPTVVKVSEDREEEVSSP